ncbi:MAG: divergent PAP2 family protein [Clostridia bacterium]|nr:divergent PAP2 family protein [Clostridia bacterium]
MGTIWNNKHLWIPIITWLIVQTLKLIIDLVKNKKLNVKRLWGAGGMPSSHSAIMTSLDTTIALTEGLESPLFALALIMTFVVMYDATGVRRAAGKQARVLNQIIESDGKNINIQEKLIELLGHTPIEVFVGAFVGILLAIILNLLW